MDELAQSATIAAPGDCAKPVDSQLQGTPAGNSLDRRIVDVHMISGGIVSMVWLLLSAAGMVVMWLSSGLGTAWYGAVGAAIAVLILLIVQAVLWPRIWFRNYRWSLNEESLQIERGVWWRHRISIPLGRVQHADVTQGPLLRIFDLGVLVVHTAGTSHAQIVLEGLPHSVALQVRDRLVQQTQSMVVT